MLKMQIPPVFKGDLNKAVEEKIVIYPSTWKYSNSLSKKCAIQNCTSTIQVIGVKTLSYFGFLINL